VRPVRRRRAVFRWPGAGPTRAAVQAGRCALNTTTSPSRPSPPPPCAGRRSCCFAPRGRSRTSIGSAPCPCGPSSASGLCALIVGGVPPFAGPAPGPRGPPPGPDGALWRGPPSGRGTGGSASRLQPRRGSQPSRRTPSDRQVWGADSDTSWRRRGRRFRDGSTVTSAVGRRPLERPARHCCFAPGGDLALPPARRRAPAGRPPHQGRAPCSSEARHLLLARRWAFAGRRPGRAVRPEYDHLAVATVTSAAVRRPLAAPVAGPGPGDLLQALVFVT
jgi:hypothetical protein